MKNFAYLACAAMVAVAAMYVANQIAGPAWQAAKPEPAPVEDRPGDVHPAEETVTLRAVEKEPYFDAGCEETYVSELVPLTAEEQRELYGAAKEFEIPYAVALGVIEVETRFSNVIGDGGKSIGYMQIQPRWWSELLEHIGAEDLTAAKDNFRGGCAILQLLRDTYGGRMGDALSAYNTGRPGVTRYAADVMEAAERWGKVIGE